MSEDGSCEYVFGCEGAVTHEPDPYASEIHGDETPVWLCEEHRWQHAQDI